MGKVSVKENKNIYQITREELGLSRAAAAELMINEGMTEYRLAKIATLSDEVLPVADYNADGKVNVKDATAIQKKIAGLI